MAADAPYAQPADLIARFDARTVGNLASDTGRTVEVAALLVDPNVLAALATASGLIESALLQGEHYTVDDLQSLTANSQAYLTDMTCRVAFAKLLERRPYTEERTDALKRADDELELLRTGKHVFNLAGQIGAGVPDIYGPSCVQERSLNTIAQRSRGRFYPHQVLPWPQG